MTYLDPNRLYRVLKKNYCEPDWVINDIPYTGIQIRVTDSIVTCGEMKQMTAAELYLWWQDLVLVKVEGQEAVLYRAAINNKRKLYYIRKATYKIKNFKTATKLAKRIIKDLAKCFQITAEF